MFKCETIKWEYHFKKKKRRSKNWLKCIGEKSNIEYRFFEPDLKGSALSVVREDLIAREVSGPTIECYKCVEELKRFLNEGTKGPITCDCAPFPIEREFRKIAEPIGKGRVVTQVEEYQFEILNNQELRISQALTEVDTTSRMYTDRPIELVSHLDVPKSILPNFKSFLNDNTWIIPESEEIIKTGLEIIREKVENCDTTVLEYIKGISSEMEIGLYLEKTITDEYYDKANDEIYDLIDKFIKNCTYSKK